jgi:carotenoid cleavage dioxygenase
VAEQQAGHRIYNSSFSPPPNADQANTNIVRHGGRYLALFEGGMPYQVDRELETVGLFDYDGKLVGRMSAHPKIDPATGELLSISYDLRAGTLAYLRARRDGALDRVVEIPSPWPAIVHDIAITERHVVACLGPLVFDWTRKGPPAAWEPERGSMIAVVPRDATAAFEVAWIKAAPFFQFHTMNAFEEDGRIELVLPWYDSFSLTHPSKRLELHRLVIDIQGRSVTDQPIDDRACEFSRVNDAHLGRRARYGYVGLRDPRPGESFQVGAFESFARYDLSTGQKTVHQFPAGVTVCEPVFVADPAGKNEEDGFILTFAHDKASEAGSFVILDARNLAGNPLAVVRLPRRVPAGLHASWIPA